jgi:DNA-binding helix-hairpin-helix protein with protein kinase domain
MSLQGRTLRMVRAGTPVSVGERVSDSDAFTVYLASAGDAPLAVSWYPDLPGTRALAKLLTWLVDIESPHPAFTWPIDTVMSEEMPGFGLIKPLPEPGLESLGHVLSRAESPSFPALISIGRQLVSAFDGLHEAGMCYRDISLATILVDADRAQIALVDIDAIAPDHSERYIGSTSPFMAPEVVRGEAPVSWRSDRHSLAVLLFFLFMHGHPLDGKDTDPRAGDESEVTLRAFGLEPVFVFDPGDDSNRPMPGDQVLFWWPIYPRFIRASFERAFTTGLADPAAGRVTEEQWLSALARLEDCVATCSCRASVFRDPEDPGQRCWNCGLTVQ